jgi:hypothetical protein
MRRFFGGLRALVQRRKTDRDLDDELQAYVDAAVDQKVRDGLSRDDAVRAARREIGSPILLREQVRAVGWESHVDAWAQDVRYAARRLRAARGFSAIAIITLALGIGANTAIFSLFNGVLRPAVPNLDRLAVLTHVFKSGHINIPALYEAELERVANQPDSPFDRLFTSDSLAGPISSNGRTGIAAGERVSGGYFAAFDIVPLAGRLLNATDDAGTTTVGAVISEGLWRRWFDADPKIIGTPLLVCGVPTTIVGVVPASFRGTWLPTMNTTDFWVPVAGTDKTSPLMPTGWARPPIEHRTFGHLRAGMSLERADAAVRTLGQNPPADSDITGLAALAGIRGIMFDDYGRIVMDLGVVVLAVSGLVFLIACTNLANLVAARTTTRTGEIAIRLATGASRARIFRLLVTEALMLSALGGLAGVAVTLGATTLIARLPLPIVDGTPVRIDPSPDWRVLGYAIAAATAAAMA